MPLDQLKIDNYPTYKMEIIIDRVDGNYVAVSSRLDILPKLPEPLQSQILQEILRGIRLIAEVSKDEFSKYNNCPLDISRLQISLLLDTVPYLSEPLKSQTLQEIQEKLATVLEEEVPAFTISSDSVILFLENLPPKWYGELFRGWGWGGTGPNDYSLHQHNIPILAVFGQLLPEPLKTKVLKKALSLAREVNDNTIQMQTFRYLIPQLIDPLRNEVLNEFFCIALMIFDDQSLARSEGKYLDESAFQHILSVLSYFENSKQMRLVQRLLIGILSLKDKVKATDYMSKLLPHIQKLPNSLKIHIWQDTLRSLSGRMRENLLEVLPVLQPFMINFGGIGTIEETFRSIQTVSRWWP